MKKNICAILTVLFCIVMEFFPVSADNLVVKDDIQNYYTTDCGDGYIKWIYEDSIEYNETEFKKNGFKSDGTKILVYFSTDRQNWTEILNDNNRDIFERYYQYRYHPACKVLKCDDYYVMYYCNNSSNIGINNNRDEGSITVFDKYFNVVKDCPEMDYIENLSYVNGVCYITQYTEYLSDTLPPNPSKYGWRPYIEYGIAIKKRTMYSSDFENWEVYSEDGQIPLVSNGNVIIASNAFLTTLNRKNSYTFLNTIDIKKTILNQQYGIIYEDFEPAWLTVLHGMYVCIPNYETENYMSKLWISKDGVYFASIDCSYENIPQEIKSIDDYYDGLLVYTTASHNSRSHEWNSYFYGMSELSELINHSEVYVCLNDKVLGFSQPPIIEDGRMLVPMRFLFEQMGADVEWNAETQTATAALNNTAVTFAIDDTEATVNNQSATMEVPAQLVNGKTMVPLRFLSEKLGYNVTWNEEARTAVIE